MQLLKVILRHPETIQLVKVYACNVAFHHDMMKAAESHCHFRRPHCPGKNKALARFHALQSNLDKFTLDLVINIQNFPNDCQGGALGVGT